MLKFILISLLVIFVLSRIGGFLFRTLFWMLGMRMVEKQMRQQPSQRQQPPRRPEGDIVIDHAAQDSNGRRSKNSPKDGDYIDYEEIK